MAFYNRVRLPFYLSQPQFTVEEEVYVKANGTRRVLRSQINKELQARTDWMPAIIHERFAVALRHDEVQVEGAYFNAGIRISGAYEIEWQNFLDHPIAPASFKALQEAFIARQTRCGTCPPVASSLNVRDDLFETPLDEGASEEINVSLNDDICCPNPQFYLFAINSTYVDSVTIDPDTGVASMVLKTPLPSTGQIEFFQYKVICDNGLEGIGIVRGSIIGSQTTPCPIPTALGVVVTDPFDGTAVASWTAPGSPPANGYAWYLAIDDGVTETTVQSGTTASTSVNLSGLLPESVYHFYVKSVCGEGDESQYIRRSFNTPEEADPPTYNYLCEVYLCTNCADPIGTVIASHTNPALPLFDYYKSGASPTEVLRPISTSLGVAATTIGVGGFDTCTIACETEVDD